MNDVASPLYEVDATFDEVEPDCASSWPRRYGPTYIDYSRLPCNPISEYLYTRGLEILYVLDGYWFPVGGNSWNGIVCYRRYALGVKKKKQLPDPVERNLNLILAGSLFRVPSVDLVERRRCIR